MTNANLVEKCDIDIMVDHMDANPTNNVQDVLDGGQAAYYENEDGMLVEEFPDGRIFHISYDMEKDETVYIKRLK